MELELHLEVDPVPASRPRFVKRGNYTRTYYAGRYKEFLQETGPVALDAALREAGCSSLPFTGPVSVYCEFHCRRPKTTKLDAPKPDIDNYLKSILDLLQPTVLKDDAQVEKLYAFKQWAEGEPCIKLTVRARS